MLTILLPVSRRPLHISPFSSTTNQASSVNISDSDPLPEQFRGLMRLLTHPVVVLTAHDGTHPRAMAMSSFTSLALAPTPLVTFNIASPSRTLDAIKHGAGSFNVHILSADQRGADVADNFTRGSGDHVFDGVEHRDAGDGSPPVLEGEGVLYVLRCRLAREDAPGSGALLRVRDHTIVVAEVMDMIPGAAGGRDLGFGLAYADRRYRRVGDAIKKHDT
ncbi:hypothetical protein ACRE_072960 [Hapsidospora chrysogenum ATCC 11550]|uniref:Flavin reductase like domain-containing protein n=1 Tax=Hapsidospora chrysogenum (strain ATCC 11550 / CBS 779.69 / DSM 880 / IAM 14645 / JCM 23072 / IMI 49137) TaxID=857340 RepID=A0A086SXZ4_HAPC1|nr:hypothetical protein ACRE_072960 [Hapsidospora chrysogenum ATCC 11550]